MQCHSFVTLIILYGCFHAISSETDNYKPKIAIVGAGISGTSAAYFLSKIPNWNTQIDVYAKDPVGGRLATIKIGDHEYETGGSILHPRNRYMKQFTEEFGLKPKKGMSGKFGLYDGNTFVYSEGNWKLLNLGKLMWRYGTSLFKINSMISEMLSYFDRIYHTQDQGFGFTSVTDLLSAMDPSFTLMLERSLAEGLSDRGISKQFIEELAEAVMRVNYGQSTEAHQFVGSVSLAGAEPGLWSIHGGNKQVPEALLNASRANFYEAEVAGIRLLEDGKFALRLHNDANNAREYDAVILATPLTDDTTKIELENFPKRSLFPGYFHQTVCTMVQGEINRKYFKFSSPDSVIEDIFTTNRSLFFNSVARNYPINIDDGTEGLPPVWKVFSNELLTDEQLQTLFSEINEKHVIPWKAYPEYDGTGSVGNFTLHRGLYHINAIEFAASAMEMQVIGARNVALLTASHFGIDTQDHRTQKYHVEL